MKYITLIFLIFLLSCYSKNAEKTNLKGKTLPSFNLLLTDSITYFNTNSIHIGKPVVLFYFGPHCPYSRAQMEEIIKNIYVLKDIQFYVFTTWSFSEMKSFYENYKLNKYSNITVGVDYANFFAKYFKAQGVPYMAIYGKDKKLKEAFIGEVYSTQIKEVAN